MFTTTSRRGIAAVLAAAFMLAACGSGTGDQAESTGVASLSDEAATDAGAADGDSADGDSADGSTADGDTAGDGDADSEASDDPELAFARYDDCMTDAGFDFGSTLVSSDDADASGSVVIEEIEVGEGGADPQQGLDAIDFNEEFAAADKECSKHLEGLDISFDMSPEEQAAMEDAQLAWTECMRENGIEVPDFDPASGGVTIIGGPEDGSDPQAGGIDDSDFDFEAFEQANEECNEVFEEQFGESAVFSESTGS